MKPNNALPLLGFSHLVGLEPLLIPDQRGGARNASEGSASAGPSLFAAPGPALVGVAVGLADPRTGVCPYASSSWLRAPGSALGAATDQTETLARLTRVGA